VAIKNVIRYEDSEVRNW